MALRRSDEHTRILRQNIVSSAKLRGMTNNEIVTFLAENNCLNPRTNSPWGLSTITKDLREIEERWRDEMFVNITEHRARVLAELREAKAAAWSGGQISLVLRAIDQEVNLLGLNELERMSIEIALANLLKGFPKEIADELKNILAKKVSEKKKLSSGTKLITLKRSA